MLTRRKLKKPMFLLFGGVTIVSILSLVGVLIMSSRASTPDVAIESVKSSPAPAVPIQAPNHGLPMQLKIPRLNIETPITYMGLNESGEMDTPKSATEVGWYKYGALPGNEGSAVISGHIVGSRGVPAIFRDLDKMQVGDLFSVVDNAGQSAVFEVREIRTYDQDEQPAEVFKSTEGSHLNLISCTGDWDRVQHHYVKRLVVFGDKVT